MARPVRESEWVPGAAIFAKCWPTSAAAAYSPQLNELLLQTLLAKAFLANERRAPAAPPAAAAVVLPPDNSRLVQTGGGPIPSTTDGMSSQLGLELPLAAPLHRPASTAVVLPPDGPRCGQAGGGAETRARDGTSALLGRRLGGLGDPPPVEPFSLRGKSGTLP